jgi:aspartate/methionine/tyrosine aminotransferase
MKIKMKEISASASKEASWHQWRVGAGAARKHRVAALRRHARRVAHMAQRIALRSAHGARRSTLAYGISVAAKAAWRSAQRSGQKRRSGVSRRRGIAQRIEKAAPAA